MIEIEQNYTSRGCKHYEESAGRIQSVAVDSEKLNLHVADINPQWTQLIIPRINIVSNKIALLGSVYVNLFD